MRLFSLRPKKIAHIGGWEYDLETGELTWTDEVYRIHEIPIGTSVKVEDGISHYPGKAKDIIQGKIELAIEEGIPWDKELPFITAKGNHIWVSHWKSFVPRWYSLQTQQCFSRCH